MLLASLDHPFFPVPQQSKRDVQLASDCAQFFSFQNSAHRCDLKIAAEPSPAVERLFHEPLFFLRPLSFFHNTCLIFGVHSSSIFNSYPIRIGNWELSIGQIFSPLKSKTYHEWSTQPSKPLIAN